MMVEEAFAKIIGRQPSDAERQRLYRVRDALGLSDNDAFWYILMILEHYDSLYRDYPRQISEQAQATLENLRQAFATAAALEAAKAENVLAQKVAETSVAIARRLAERPVGVHRVTAVLAAVVVFGATCMAAGFELAGRGQPVWCRHAGSGKGAVVAVVLGAPAGWMAFALLVPSAAYGAKLGWTMANEVDGTVLQKILGWSLAGLSVVAAVACAMMLVRLIG